MVEVKIVVKTSGNPSIKLLKFLLQNIDGLNQAKIIIKVIKLTDKECTPANMKRLTKLGVSVVPFMITDTRVYQGNGNIMDFFKYHVEQYNKLQHQRKRLQDIDAGQCFGNSGDPELQQFYRQTIDESNNDCDDSESAGLDKALNDYKSRMRTANQQMKHRGMTGAFGSEDDDDDNNNNKQQRANPQRGFSINRNKSAASNNSDDNPYLREMAEDNVDTSDGMGRYMNNGADDDSRMSNAMFDKMGGGSYIDN